MTSRHRGGRARKACARRAISSRVHAVSATPGPSSKTDRTSKSGKASTGDARSRRTRSIARWRATENRKDLADAIGRAARAFQTRRYDSCTTSSTSRTAGNVPRSHARSWAPWGCTCSSNQRAGDAGADAAAAAGSGSDEGTLTRTTGVNCSEERRVQARRERAASIQWSPAVSIQLRNRGKNRRGASQPRYKKDGTRLLLHPTALGQSLLCQGIRLGQRETGAYHRVALRTLAVLDVSRGNKGSVRQALQAGIAAVRSLETVE